ncbi:heme oxygenase [Luteibacter sp. HA06]
MAGAAGVTPAHLVLREATRDAHEAAEATAGMRLLLAGELGETGYAALLRAQLSLFRKWEAARSNWLAGLTEWRYTSRATLIEADLRESRFSGDAPCGSRFSGDALSLCGSRFSGDALPHETATLIADKSAPTVSLAPTLSSAPTGGNANWGELYVIEGSALGGRVIARRLRELYPQLSHTFYAVGENAPSNWRRFQSLLDHALPDAASQQAAVEAARRMFAQFQQTLTDPAVHD